VNTSLGNRNHEHVDELSDALLIDRLRCDAAAARQQAAETRQVVLERVHHEFRTPLATLLGHVEMLQDDDADLPFRLEVALAAISRSGDRLSELLAHLDELVGQPAG
jgi:signal transduction histidine kinase